MDTQLAAGERLSSSHWPARLITIATLAWGIAAFWRVGKADPTVNFPLLDRMEKNTYAIVFQFVPTQSLVAWLRLDRQTHARLHLDSRLRNRASIRGVLVWTGDGQRWLDSDDDTGWNQVIDFEKDLLAINPGALPGRLQDATPQVRKTLIDRLPLACWREEARLAAVQDREPFYLRSLSHILFLKLTSMIALAQPDLTNEARKLRAAQLLLSMYGYLTVGGAVARESAEEAAWDVAWDAARIAGQTAAWNAALDTARAAAQMNGAVNAWYAARLVAREAALKAARDAAQAAVRQLCDISDLDQPPPAEVIGRVAYRAAELSALIAVLEQSAAVVEGIFAATAGKPPQVDELAIFASPENWEAFKLRYFGQIGQDKDKIHILRPWLALIDPLVVKISAHPADGG